MSEKRIYLDYAATTPVDLSVWNLFQQISLNNWANPSGMHTDSQRARFILEQSRRSVAEIIQVKNPNNIVFTSSATEANNLAIKGLLDTYISQGQIPHILISSIEHDCVLEASHSRGDRALVGEIPVSSEGVINIENVASLIKPETKLISVMLVNNEIGTVQPIKDLSNMLYEMNQDRLRAGEPAILLHVDASQAPLYFEVSVNELGCDLLTLSGHKIYGIKGSACLYISNSVSIVPQTLGGKQEHGLRSGTVNVAAAAAMAEALKKAQNNYQQEFSSAIQKRDYLKLELEKMMNELGIMDRYRINGSWEYRSPANLNFSLKGFDHQTVLTALDIAGISVSGGSSCSSGSEEISHVIRNINQDTDWLEKMATIRVSLGLETTRDELDLFVARLYKILNSLNQN
ncbi:MAG: cysteine desulfurase NifS [Patescibacteria group bacterium]